MSTSLFAFVAADPVGPEPPPARFELRKNRRRKLHPDEISKSLAARSKTSADDRISAAPFGWILLYWLPNGQRVKAELPPRTSYAEACAIRAERLALAGYGESDLSSWLITKTEP